MSEQHLTYDTNLSHHLYIYLYCVASSIDLINNFRVVLAWVKLERPNIISRRVLVPPHSTT